MVRRLSVLALVACFTLGQSPAPPSTADPTIASLVAAVSAERIHANDERLVGFGTRNAYSEKSGSRTRGVFAARDWIASQFRETARASGGRMTVAFDEYEQAPGPRIPRAVKISSVVATLRGDEPGGRTYVVSSHYDDCNSDCTDGVGDAPGADDNGSAASCVLEAARVMAKTRFRATVLFVTYDAEDIGLLGSAHHAATLKAAGVDVQGDVNNDIIGASTDWEGHSAPGEVRLFSEQRNDNDSPSRQLARFAKENAERYVPSMHVRLIYRVDRFLRGGDQQSFLEQGFAGVRYVEPYENYDHQHQNVRVEGGKEYGDLLRFMDFAYLGRVCQVNVATLSALALGPGEVRNLKVLTRNLTNDTTLTWDPTPGAVAYEIVARDTADPLWGPPVMSLGVTTATVRGYSKDNWLFGVRAVDAQGHRGVAAFPTPQR